MVYYIGVDVGTQSVRSSLVDSSGKEHARSSAVLTVYNPRQDQYEQSCDEIWKGVCSTVKSVLKGVKCSDVAGVGFDATCSLVVVDDCKNPLSVSQDGLVDRTCLMWMDHRAVNETCIVNSTKSYVTQYVGGGFSPEQQPPKLLWIKKNLPEIWIKAAHFFDLPDWLTFKATGSTVRSLCSVTCKWGYVSHRGGWCKDFLVEIGLGDLSDYKKLGNTVLSPGMPVPGGLSETASKELCLVPSIPVGVSMIDAHAGTLAMLCYSPIQCESLCIISGTSTCIMGLSDIEKFVPGVWGPYQGAILPRSWLFEGGQTAAGSALDHILKSHPAYSSDMTFSYLNSELGDVLSDPVLHKKTSHLHIQPDLHGNRSPLALPWFRGMLCGIDLDSDFENLLVTYLASLQGLAMGIRSVMEQLSEHGVTYKRIIICGGLAANPLYLNILSSVTKLPVVMPSSSNMMCLGSVLLAQSAAEEKPLDEVIKTNQSNFSGKDSTVIHPEHELSYFYDAKYEVYCQMTADQIKYRKIMSFD